MVGLFQQERVKQRIDDQIVYVPARGEVSFPQVVEQLGKVPKFSSHDRSLQRQIVGVHVPQLVEVPKIVSEDRIQHEL